VIAPTAKVAGATELERLVHRSRRLGADSRLVVHGGGNTSSKLVEPDHLGRSRLVVRVKSSGSDLATVTASDFPGLYLDDLLELRERKEMTDDELIAFLDRCKVEPSSKRPSIETLLHAFLPARHVDHVHSDAICALTNTPSCNELIADALGDDVVVIPYIRPGFGLAKAADSTNHGRAIVLRHHGLVTWGETHEEALNQTIELDSRARDYLAARRARRSEAGEARRSSKQELLTLLPRLRGAISHGERRILHIDYEQRWLADRPDVDTVATVARSTPDHMLHIGRESFVLRNDWEACLQGTRTPRESQPDQEHARATVAAERRAEPPDVFLVPGTGCIAAGISKRQAVIRAEIASHSHRSVADTLDAFGAVTWLDEQQASEFQCWPLERYKLTLASPPSEFAGHVVLVTGAASGIGREVALDLSARGAHLVLADQDAHGMDETARQIDPDLAVCVPADLTVERDVAAVVRTAIETFGGIDGVVSNAGVAVAGRLAELKMEDWQRSLAINATSHFLVTRAVWPILEAQQLGASLVYVASKNAFSPGAGFGAYSAAKAAEIQLARIAALEGGAKRIRSNVVNPDAIFTGSRLWSRDMRRERAREHQVELAELESFYASRNLLGQTVTTSHVAHAVAFLLSPRAEATTGCVLTVDGGVPGAFPR
jgi:rhamnulose-1-phosphate aldolase/alcohol dehydrogenase